MLTGFVPLRCSTDQVASQAAAAHELQLLDLSAATLGSGATNDPSQVKVLARKNDSGSPTFGETNVLRLVRLCQLRLRYALGTNRSVQEPNGVNFRNFDPSIIESTRVRSLGWRRNLEISGLKQCTRSSSRVCGLTTRSS
jgi:hypothetical protein